MKLSVSDGIERAIELFSHSELDAIDVVNHHNEVVGLLSLDDLSEVLSGGNVGETIGQIIQNVTTQHSTLQVQEVEKNQYSALLESPVFTDIINSLYDGVFITDGYGITVKVNKSYERITNLKAEQLIGYHMEDLIKAGYISKSASIQVLKEKKPITLMQSIHNGRKIIVSGTPIFNEDHDILYVVNSVRDITELLKLKLQIDELQELKALRNSSNATFAHQSVESSIYSSEIMMKLFTVIDRVAKSDAKVLLQGETGVGKTMIAKYMHEHSNRSDGSFLELNCGAFPPNLIEAELFGYEPGAFTGALTKGKKGLLEVADNGTLFLDEIGDLPLELQVKLLKVIEDKAFIPIGSSKLKHINVRIIAASHRNIRKLVEVGDFREDLFYRLNVVPIEIPSLRERREEILHLSHHFLEDFNREYDTSKTLSIEVLDTLHDYQWPGNIRELKNLIERLVVITSSDQIELEDLPYELIDSKSKVGSLYNEEIIPLKEAIERVERQMITKALRKYKTTRKAAEVLEVSQSTIVQKMKKWRFD
ncbi:sigma 54-interacting transcriptional regulator [Pseudalkalibacillus hwajinpoensis]|uniref:sigma 54-interacting transcriptional regulator n=1 Tax=Guptibacillus hwajinpoensis TaxID=208199 RepID=UPI00325B07C0